MSDQGKGKIGVIGTGKIAVSLAVLFTGNGYETTMLARTDKGHKSGVDLFETYYRDLVTDQLITQDQSEICRKYLKTTWDYADLAEMDCIFESVIEDLAAKQFVYRQIADHAPNVKAVGSATSSIMPDILMAGMDIADRFVVSHPFNPSHMIPCFEIVRSSETTDEAVEYICSLLKDVGREPVVLLKSAAGFIVNRLQQAMYRESVYMVENGIATADDIDRALRFSVAPRYTSIGLFEHFDNAGLDLDKQVSDIIYPTLCNATKTQDAVMAHINAGELGLKTGKGMIDWSTRDLDDFRKRCSKPYYKYFNWKLPEK